MESTRETEDMQDTKSPDPAQERAMLEKEIDKLNRERRMASLDAIPGQDPPAHARLREVERKIAGVEERIRAMDSEAAAERESAEAQRIERARAARPDAVEKMTAMLVKFDGRFDRDLERLLSQRKSKAEDVLALYMLGRQAYSLRHDLYSLTGDPRHGKTWDVPARLGQLTELIPECFATHTSKPRVEKPWAELYESAKVGT